MMATSNSSGEDTLAIHVEMALQRFKVLLTGEMDDEAETYRITYLKVCIFIFSFQFKFQCFRQVFISTHGWHTPRLAQFRGLLISDASVPMPHAHASRTLPTWHLH